MVDAGLREEIRRAIERELGRDPDAPGAPALTPDEEQRVRKIIAEKMKSVPAVVDPAASESTSSTPKDESQSDTKTPVEPAQDSPQGQVPHAALSTPTPPVSPMDAAIAETTSFVAREAVVELGRGIGNAIIAFLNRPRVPTPNGRWGRFVQPHDSGAPARPEAPPLPAPAPSGAPPAAAPARPAAAVRPSPEIARAKATGLVGTYTPKEMNEDRGAIASPEATATVTEPEKPIVFDGGRDPSGAAIFVPQRRRQEGA